MRRDFSVQGALNSLLLATLIALLGYIAGTFPASVDSLRDEVKNLGASVTLMKDSVSRLEERTKTLDASVILSRISTNEALIRTFEDRLTKLERH